MERPTWVTRPTILRTDAVNWAPKPTEPLSRIIVNQTRNKVREDIVQELWGRYGNERTLGRFVERIRTQEGLIEPK